MNYATSYATLSNLVETIRTSAAQGKSVKMSSGLASRLEGAPKMEVASMDEVRAKYMAQIQDMFSSPTPVGVPEEIANEIAGPSTKPKTGGPRRNPATFSADLPQMSERDVLAMTIQAEAGGEGYKGMLAVGAVMDNRRKAGNYGSDFHSVLLAPGQFSAWNALTGYAGGEGGIDMSALKPSAAAYKIADQIMSGDYESPVGNATHYYNPKLADPIWGARAGGNWTTLGNHVFGIAD